MPAILIPIVEWFTATAWPAIVGLAERCGAKALWPYLVRLTGWLGIGKFLTLCLDWIKLHFAEHVMENVVAGMVVFALLGAYAAFLLVFWNFSAFSVIKEFFSADPFADVHVMGNALYLVSHAFPVHFFFGTAIAYIQWRLTVVQAALVLNRLVKLTMRGV
jgi:hypothetical protein